MKKNILIAILIATNIVASITAYAYRCQQIFLQTKIRFMEEALESACRSSRGIPTRKIEKDRIRP